MTRLDWVGSRLNQFEMCETHENCLSTWKQCCSSWKQCWMKTMYNRVCKSLKLFVRVWSSQLSYTELYDCQYEVPSYCEPTVYLSSTIYEVNGTARYLECCSPATNNSAIITTLLHHQEDNFSKLTDKNRPKIDRNKYVLKKMVDQLSSGTIDSDCHIYTDKRQHIYLQIQPDFIGSAATWRGRGEEYVEEGIYDNEGWQFSHYDTTARGGISE